MATIEEKDKQYIWHPFTQMKSWCEEKQTVIVEAAGIKLRDCDGREYYDGVSSLWVNLHGHRRAEIDAAIISQLGKVAHSTALGLMNVPAAEFAEMLVQAAPEGLTKVFYSDDGSTAVEVALKMAFQYWQHQGKKQKQRFIALDHAYHGDTVGSVSVGGVSLFHDAFRPLLFETERIPSPSCYHCSLSYGSCGMKCLQALEDLLREKHHTIAGLVIEPMVQAAAGMLMSPPGYLRRVRELTEKYAVLLIADEVATGFGRTGTMFACEHEAVNPDFMCLSKGITGGYMPLAATLTTDEIYQSFIGTTAEKRTFYHGHSYTANQLACAAGIASLKIFSDDKVLAKLSENIEWIKPQLAAIAGLEHVGDVRQCGMIIGIELMKDKTRKIAYPWDWGMGAAVCRQARALGLFIRPVGDVVVFMPPLCSTQMELGEMLAIIEQAINMVTSGENAAPHKQGGEHF